MACGKKDEIKRCRGMPLLTELKVKEPILLSFLIVKVKLAQIGADANLVGRVL